MMACASAADCCHLRRQRRRRHAAIDSASYAARCATPRYRDDAAADILRSIDCRRFRLMLLAIFAFGFRHIMLLRHAADIFISPPLRQAACYAAAFAAEFCRLPSLSSIPLLATLATLSQPLSFSVPPPPPALAAAAITLSCRCFRQSGFRH
jgi:hypothetical protein